MKLSSMNSYLLLMSLALAACGGGGGSGGGSLPPGPGTTYTIGGTVTNLRGTGLVLHNGSEDLPIASDGSYVFATTLSAQTSYDVTASAQPEGPWQTCTVNRGTGTVGTANVTDIEVTCATNTYAVGGFVSGVAGGTLVLRNNGGDDLGISGSATQAFTFAAPVASGERYEVTIASAPPSLTCTLGSASGEITDQNIQSVAVNCSTISYTIGGAVSGLLPQDLSSAGLELILSANERLAIHNSGSFTFNTPVASGSQYTVTLATQPTSPAQTCFVTPASAHGGPVTANVTTVDIQCLALSTSGSLDPDFGTAGIALIDFESLLGPDLHPSAVIQPVNQENKILIAGTTGQAASFDFGLFRLNTNGSLDTGFNGGNNNGFVRTDISPSSSYSIDYMRALANQSDGKIVVAGYTAAWDFALVRYSADGVIDTTFGTNGITITDINLIDYALAMAIDSSNRIVLVGMALGTGEDFAIARYTASGLPDANFNGGDVTNTTGAIRVHFSRDDRAQAVAIQSDGKIVVGGYANGANSDFAVARLNTDGSLDTSFGVVGTGKVTTHLGSVDRATALVIQASGEIVLAGYTGVASGINFGLVRYTSGGVPDASFDGDGIVTTDIGANVDQVHAMTLDANNNIVVAGSSHNGLNSDFALARYVPSGALDSSFGNGGIITTPVGGGADVAYSVVIQPDGKIVAVGQAENGTNGNNVNTDFAAIRVIP